MAPQEGWGELYKVLSSPRDFLRPLQWSEVFQGAAGDCVKPVGFWFQHFPRA